MEWMFDGIGTQIIASVITFVIGLLSGSIAGYAIGIKKNQRQIAGDDSTQEQRVNGKRDLKNIRNKKKIYSDVNQSQRAGNNAKQTQINIDSTDSSED